MTKRDTSIVESVDFTRLNEILKEKGIKKAKLSRRCGYDSGYVGKHIFREKKLNWTVANTLKKEYGISPDEYTYKKPEKSTSNDGQLALRIDKDLIAKFRNWAFYNELSQKEAMEKMISEYLDGKKTTATASNDEPEEEAKETEQKKETITFAFRTDQDTVDLVRGYAFLKNKKVKEVMEEIIVKQLGDVKLPEREEGK